MENGKMGNGEMGNSKMGNSEVDRHPVEQLSVTTAPSPSNFRCFKSHLFFSFLSQFLILFFSCSVSAQ